MTSETTSFVIAFAALLFVYSLVSQRISKTVVTGPMIFVVAGMLLSPEGLDMIELSASSSFVLTVAEVALVLTLFADASRTNLGRCARRKACKTASSFLPCPL